MTRDNLLFAIIGLLFGFILGFMSYSTMMQRNSTAPAAIAGGANLPADHPPVGADSGGGGNPQQIFAQVQQSLKQAQDNPNDFDAQVIAGKLEYQIQKFDKAIEFFLKANQIQPNNAEVVAMLAIANLDAGNYDAAEKWYRAALAKKPDDVVMQDGFCAALLGKGNVKEAEAAIEKLAKLDPTNQDLPQFREKLASLKK